MATCGTSEHTKAHAGLQDPSRSQVLTIHFKVHTNTPVLFTSFSILKTFQLKGFTLLSYTSVSKPFASYSLLFSRMFCSLHHPAISLQLLIFLTLLLSCLTMFSLLISFSALDSLETTLAVLSYLQYKHSLIMEWSRWQFLYCVPSHTCMYVSIYVYK